MTWYFVPDIAKLEGADRPVWQVNGDWTRDLPSDVRASAQRQLAQVAASNLILDLTDVRAIDSWGEEEIAGLIQRVQDDGFSVAWVFDDARPVFYEGLRRAFERREMTAAGHPTRAAAIRALENAP